MNQHKQLELPVTVRVGNGLTVTVTVSGYVQLLPAAFTV